jgi:hypothetical protein
MVIRNSSRRIYCWLSIFLQQSLHAITILLTSVSENMESLGCQTNDTCRNFCWKEQNCKDSSAMRSQVFRANSNPTYWGPS